MTFNREDTLALIRVVDDLPTLPDRFFQIQEVINRSESASADLAAIIGTDQATTLMVLKIANSVSLNPLGKPVSKLSHAITRLGYRETANVASAMALFYGFSLRTGMANVRAFWGQTYAVAVLSKQMAKVLKLDAEEIFVAGLLHDIGRVILGLRVDLEYFDSEVGTLSGAALVEKERDSYGLDHTEAGGEILSLWCYPSDMIKAIEKHHEPDSDFLPARVISLADRAIHKYLPYFTDIGQVQMLLKEQFPEGVSALLQSEGLLNQGTSE